MKNKQLRLLTVTTALAFSPVAYAMMFAWMQDAQAAPINPPAEDSLHAESEDKDIDTTDLLNLSLEQLSNVAVTSVSKKAEKITEAPAAIYVITQEDIKRSGATAIPELLRMVPGLTVTRAGSHDWTVTSRGSNDQFSNKLLVLMDGRTIYSPLFSGVIWDVQDTMLEDIERIEVIRGPGATLWGANAVNGAINIITKNAKDTQGGLAVVSAGNQVKGIGSVRYGGKIGDNSYLRTYAKHTSYNSEYRPAGGTANDNWDKQQAGFRGDLTVSDKDKVSIQGDLYTINEDINYTVPDPASATYYTPYEGAKAKGANIITKWERSYSKESQSTLQVYLDHTSYKTVFFNDETNTADVDFQHVWTGWDHQEVVWGAGYRLVRSMNKATAQYALTPSRRDDSLFNAFVQDKFTLLPEELFLTLGSRFEHNNYSGVEIQPSARMSWLPTDNQTLWASVSRAVHTPYRYTDDAQQLLQIVPPSISVPLPTRVSYVGDSSLESEELIAYELGYRIQPTKNLSLDAAAFYNQYDNLFNVTLGTPTVPGAYVFQPLAVANAGQASSVGGELSAKWNVNNHWQMAGSYSYINLKFDTKNNVAFSFVGKHPKHQFNVRSTYIFPHEIEMTNALYYVDDLTGIGINNYFRFDTRVAYPITENVELSVVGQNLLDTRHQEFTPFLFKNAAEIGRSVYGSVAFKF
jgi:iron complex outermembrane recepter protein